MNCCTFADAVRGAFEAVFGIPFFAAFNTRLDARNTRSQR